MTATTAEIEKPAKAKARKTAEKKPDLEIILPDPADLTVGGVRCEVQHLKTREFFMLMGLVTSTLGGDALSGLDSDDPDSLKTEVMGAVLVALPLALDDFLRLVKRVVTPVDPADAPVFNKAIDNPEPDEMLEIVDAIIENEGDNLWSLWGKAKTYLAKWQEKFKNGPSDLGRSRSTSS